MITCSTKQCYAERSEGDALFCSDCRSEWRRFCEDKELTVPMTDTKLKPILSEFKARLVAQ